MGGSHESITEVVERFENVLITGADSGTVWRNKKDKSEDNQKNMRYNEKFYFMVLK